MGESRVAPEIGPSKTLLVCCFSIHGERRMFAKKKLANEGIFRHMDRCYPQSMIPERPASNPAPRR